MSTPTNQITIVIGARANTETGFARVRRAVNNLGRSMNENLGRSGRQSGLGFLERFGNVLDQGLASVGQGASGLAEGIGNQLRTAGTNPYVAAGMAALVATLLPVLGTAIGGALVLGLGGALTGVGVMFAAKSKEVQKEFEKTGKVINKTMTEASKPLIPILTDALKTAQKLVKEFGPILKEAFGDVAPHLGSFIDNLAEGFGHLKVAIGPIMKAFGLLLDAIGPQLEETLKGVSGALVILGREFQQKDTIQNFADIIGVVLAIIPPVIYTINLLAVAMRYMRVAVRNVIGAIKDLIAWVGKIKDRTVKIAQRGAGPVIDMVRRVIGTIARFIGKTVRIGVSGVTGAIRAVGNLIGMIRNLASKTISIGVNFFKGAGSAIASALGFAHGGIIGAAGGGARSAMTLVGEQGPELVNLPAGSRVRTNADTRRMLSGGGGGGVINVTLMIGDKKLGEVLIDPLRNAIRTRGGSVQAVLGR